MGVRVAVGVAVLALREHWCGCVGWLWSSREGRGSIGLCSPRHSPLQSEIGRGLVEVEDDRAASAVVKKWCEGVERTGGVVVLATVWVEG